MSRGEPPRRGLTPGPSPAPNATKDYANCGGLPSVRPASGGRHGTSPIAWTGTTSFLRTLPRAVFIEVGVASVGGHIYRAVGFAHHRERLAAVGGAAQIIWESNIPQEKA